jgi:hypothetical protein
MAFSPSRPHAMPALLDDEPALATSFHRAQPLEVSGPLRRAVLVIGDLLAAVGIALCFPIVLLAIGIPIALCLRFLLWIVGML